MARKPAHQATEEASEQMEQLDESHIVEDTTAQDSERRRAMFAGIVEHDALIDALERKVATARADRSLAIKAICEDIGNKGPWNIGGKLISVAVRGDTYSFRTQSEAKLSL